jgi:hypothetical protein
VVRPEYDCRSSQMSSSSGGARRPSTRASIYASRAVLSLLDVRCCDYIRGWTLLDLTGALHAAERFENGAETVVLQRQCGTHKAFEVIIAPWCKGMPVATIALSYTVLLALLT